MLMAPELAVSAPAESEPGEGARRVLRWLWLPYAWLVFTPFLALSTLTWGVIAVGIAALSPRVAFHCGTIWAWCLCRVNFTWVRVIGRGHARKGQSYIVMSNHQSHFDVLSFYGHWGRQFRWVMKEELRRVPGLGWYCAAGGHVFIDRSDRQKAFASLQAAAPLLAGGISVFFFPEGRRSPDGRMREFKKGGFVMAQQMGLPILPVSISDTRHVLPARSFRLLPGLVTIRIHPPIDPAAYGEDRDRLMADTRAAIASGLSDWERGQAAEMAA
ncbi:MAG: 1-acyl-sn-glycerol-3-phosphate acyltransferase [Deltaproteobacteria bacterium]|nr:1-acyl-sn-glycerol-3-phosphate acyltransferase [Deltaproteobacteria bacterium]